MGNRRAPRLRTDATSTKITDGTTVTTTVAWKWADAFETLNFDALAIFLNPVTLSTVIGMDIALAWSDDGSTIPFDDEGNFQQSDYNIVNFTDGSFPPKDYIARLSALRGNLVAGQIVHLVYPVRAGYARIGVRANNTSGTYWVRYQRLVR